MSGEVRKLNLYLYARRRLPKIPDSNGVIERNHGCDNTRIRSANVDISGAVAIVVVDSDHSALAGHLRVGHLAFNLHLRQLEENLNAK